MRLGVLEIGGQLSVGAVFMMASLLPARVAAQTYQLDSNKDLQPHNVTVDHVTYQGRHAVRVRARASADAVYDAQKSGTGGGITSLLIAARFDRRYVLMGMTGLMLTSLVIIAIAPNLWC